MGEERIAFLKKFERIHYIIVLANSSQGPQPSIFDDHFPNFLSGAAISPRD